ncbi:MAG: hypothetical protein JWM90_207 [Thermoleophilia bacterium]|nr:hypothetical protein [Thermoleophilia bacterium]
MHSNFPTKEIHMKRPLKSVLAIGAVCAVTGAAASGIATSSAATESTATTAATTTAAAGAPPADGLGGPGGHGGRHGGGGPGGGGGGIHSESVRVDADGTGFVTVVQDSGTITAINGTTLTIKQGTATETFDTVKVKVDGTVTVERNRATAKLAALKVGDHVRVTKDGTTTRVDATTAAFEKTEAAARAQREQRPAVTWPAA